MTRANGTVSIPDGASLLAARPEISAARRKALAERYAGRTCAFGTSRRAPLHPRRLSSKGMRRRPDNTFRQRSGSRQGFSSPTTMAAFISASSVCRELLGGRRTIKSDLPLLQILFDIRQPLIEEYIVPQVGMGEIGDGGEVDQYRKIQGVGNFSLQHRARDYRALFVLVASSRPCIFLLALELRRAGSKSWDWRRFCAVPRGFHRGCLRGEVIKEKN